MAKNSSTLAKRLTQARDALGMTQGEVAQRIGITQPSYSSLERGTSKRTYFIGSLARLFNVDAYWLETGEGKMTRYAAAEPPAHYTLPVDRRQLMLAVEKLDDRQRRALLDLLDSRF